MLKLLVVRFWPVFIPVLLYLLWLYLARRKADKNGEKKPTFFEGPWLWTLVATLALAVGAFMILGAVSNDGNTSGKYVPARVVDGEIIPAHTEPAP
ncbi:MAG: hypothetical protein MK052_05080 [Alphaproteobacteria bacterium]|nr:hypothetical protein [Alphaproteobacteria bacterium]